MRESEVQPCVELVLELHPVVGGKEKGIEHRNERLAAGREKWREGEIKPQVRKAPWQPPQESCSEFYFQLSSLPPLTPSFSTSIFQAFTSDLRDHSITSPRLSLTTREVLSGSTVRRDGHGTTYHPRVTRWFTSILIFNCGAYITAEPPEP